MVKFNKNKDGSVTAIIEKGDICHICGGDMLACDCGWTKFLFTGPLEQESIVLNRRFTNFDTCLLCKGVSFVYEDEVLQMAGLTAEQRLELREKIAAGGYDVTRLLLHFGAPNLDVEKWQYSICEKCGSESDSPMRGGP